MKYLWDTNILIHYIRQSATYSRIAEQYHFFTPSHEIYLSVINMAEIQSLAYQLQWGAKKREQLQALIQQITLLDIYEETITAYARIDAFSQGKLAGNPLPYGITSRNMGKNDVWLAATAHLFDLTLVTMDNDFQHLDGQFLNILLV